MALLGAGFAIFLMQLGSTSRAPPFKCPFFASTGIIVSWHFLQLLIIEMVWFDYRRWLPICYYVVWTWNTKWWHFSGTTCLMTHKPYSMVSITHDGKDELKLCPFQVVNSWTKKEKKKRKKEIEKQLIILLTTKFFFSRGDSFEPMALLNAPYFQFCLVFEHQTSHKCSYPVQIHDSLMRSQ